MEKLPEDFIQRIIKRGYFQCPLKKSVIGITACLNLQKNGDCSCPLGLDLENKKEDINKRFDFDAKPSFILPPKLPKDIKYISPYRINYIPSQYSRPQNPYLRVFDTQQGLFTHDSRILEYRTRNEKVPTLIIIKEYKEITKKQEERVIMEFLEICTDIIFPSPFQKRRTKPEELQSLADSIRAHGILEPPIARKRKLGNKEYELIAGERRWLASKLAGIKTIVCRIVDANDLEARQIQLSENLQRQELSPIEKIESITDYLDAALLLDPDIGKEYKVFGQTDFERVRFILSKLDSDTRNKTNYFTHKFVGKIENAFQNISLKTSWRSFFIHDLPLLTQLDEDVKEVAIEKKLSKSQARELNLAKKQSATIYEELKERINTSSNKITARGIKAKIGKKSLKQVTCSQPLPINSETSTKKSIELNFQNGNSLQDLNHKISPENENAQNTLSRPHSFEEIVQNIENISAQIKTALSINNLHDENPQALLSSMESLLNSISSMKWEAEAEVTRILVALGSNGTREEVLKIPWAKRILEKAENQTQSVL